MARPWISGGYQWDAIEHRGEGRWPRLCSVSGAIDLFLQKKDAFYQNQSHWTEEPMIHLLPHWNHSGADNRIIPVWAYTNCEEAELFLNDASIGRQKLNAFDHATWNVPYAAGVLRAVAYRDAVPVCEDIQVTTGPATALKLIINAAGHVADGRDVAMMTCICVDAQGHEVPDADPLVHFDINRYGSILGTGSDLCDHIPVTSPDRKMRAGRCTVCVRVGKEAGTLTVIARAEGLASAYADVALCEACENT